MAVTIEIKQTTTDEATLSKAEKWAIRQGGERQMLDELAQDLLTACTGAGIKAMVISAYISCPLNNYSYFEED
jgi:hypothetical protein